MGRPDRDCEPKRGRHRGCCVHRIASPRFPGSGWSETDAPESVPTMRCDPATAWLAMLGGRTRFTNSTCRAHILRHRTGRRSPPPSPGTLGLRTGGGAGSTPAKRGTCPAPSRRRPFSVPCRRAARKRARRTAARRRVGAPARHGGRVVVAEDMGKRYHARRSPGSGRPRAAAGGTANRAGYAWWPSAVSRTSASRRRNASLSSAERRATNPER